MEPYNTHARAYMPYTRRKRVMTRHITVADFTMEQPAPMKVLKSRGHNVTKLRNAQLGVPRVVGGGE